MKAKISVEDELRKFLASAEGLLDCPEKNGDECYVALYHMKIISGSLKDGDGGAASILSTWLAYHKEKFRFCATDDDFYKLIGEIEKNIGEVLEPEGPLQREPSLDLGRYLRILNKPDPFKKTS